jgi:tetratricopeptide (TPR) repeat protein
LLEDTEDSRRKLEELINDDSFAGVIYQEERSNLLIEKFLDDHLSDAEKKEFDRLITKNPSLRREITFRRNIDNQNKLISLVESLEKVREDYKGDEIGVYLSIKKHLQKKQLYPLIKFAAAACVILLASLVGIIKIYGDSSPKEQRLFTEYYEPLNEETASNFLFSSNVLEEGSKEYFEKDYKNVLLILDNAPNLINIQAEKDLFCGLSYIELGNYPEAIIRFERLISINGLEYKSHAYWYLGLCYLKTDQMEKAISIFKQIIENKSYNFQAAKKILKRIE